MDYVEIHADDDGVSHFRDRSISFTLGDVAPPMMPIGVSAFTPATEFGFLTAAPGWVGGWHQPPSEGFVFVLAGEWEIEVGDGETRRFGPGAVWYHMDRAGRGHNTRVIGDTAAVCAMVKVPDGD